MEKVTSLARYRASGKTEIAQLRAETEYLSAMLARAELGLAAIGDAVIGTDANGLIDYLNDAGQRLCGYSLTELRGLAVQEVLTFRSAETNAVLANPVKRCLANKRAVARIGRSLLITRGGRGVIVQETATPVCGPSGDLTGAILVLRNLGLQNNLSERLAWQSRHDKLTGLINREEFERRLRREISLLSASHDVRHSLLYLDLDRFRVINDTAGHAAGDHALLEVARLIQDQIRSTDLATRLGGDEFAILLNDCPVNDAVRVAQQIRQTLEEHRFLWRKCQFKHTASIGVVGIDATMSTENALAAADVACYTAKESGRNSVHYCSPRETPAGYRDMQWVSQIGQACDENRFQLYCQPIVPIADAACHEPHFELLLRINDRDGKVIPAVDFLPAAERFNMMPAIDRWVLQHTLDNLLSVGYMLSVNLSGTSLSDPSFLDFARAEMRNANVAEGALCFEITETAAIGNIEAVARFMREMRDLGCAFSLDDFGSGLSSFAYLKELPVDFLKIDGRFISNVHEDSVDHTMVGAIGHIAAAIGVKTVAERVETSMTLARLRSLGIDYAQGYYFSRPVPVRDRLCMTRLAATEFRRPT